MRQCAGAWTLQQYRPFICPFEKLIAEVPQGAKILDVGCGGGLLLGLLGAAGRRPDGTGFDVSRPAIALAQRMAAASDLAGARLESLKDAVPRIRPIGKIATPLRMRVHG